MVIRAALATLVLLLLIPAAQAQTGSDQIAEGRSRYAPLLNAEATKRGIPPALADAVTTVESAYDTEARGTSGEVGLMQVLPSTADMLGFHGTLTQLADPATNIRLGVKYLAGAWQATGGQLCSTLMMYRAGYGSTTMSLRSAIYCRRAVNYLASINSPLAKGPGTEVAANLPADLATAPGGGRRWRHAAPLLLTRAELIDMRHGRRNAEDSRHFWAVEEAHIRALRNRMESRHRVRSSTHAAKGARYAAASGEGR